MTSSRNSGHICSNRTLLELKYGINRLGKLAIFGSNRTLLELKSVIRRVAHPGGHLFQSYLTGIEIKRIK